MAFSDRLPLRRFAFLRSGKLRLDFMLSQSIHQWEEIWAGQAPGFYNVANAKV